jgi:hypothetical protein
MKIKLRFAPAALAGILSVALVVAGCSTAWIQVALNDLPVVLQIVTSILSIADVAAVPQAQSAGAEAALDLQNVQKFLADYKAAQDAATQKTALSNVQAALQAASQHVGDILAAIHIKDPNKQAAVTAGVSVALSVLLSVEALLPSNAPKAVRAVRLASPKEVKRQFNAAVAGAYPGAVLR